MKIVRNNNQGISLIVLVITIIIMIILAGAVVITLSNSGIIGKANEAVDETDLAQVQDLATMLWADAYIDKKTSQEDLEKAVLKGLEDAKVKTSKYIIKVTESGVTVEKVGPWKLQKTVTDGKVTEVTVTDGTLTIDVGTTINYMPNGVGPTDAQYTGGWKILGVDDYGRLLIMSNESITGSTLKLVGSTLSETITNYLNVLTTLQETVKDYKDGSVGVEVRCVKEEDIDLLINCNKAAFGEGKIYTYGNEVTYTWKQVAEGEAPDYRPVYSYVYNGETKTGQLSYEHKNGFIYYDKETGKIITVPYANGGAIATIKNDYYNCEGASCILSTTPAYKMIFRKTDDSDYAYQYWLANSFVATMEYSVADCVRVVLQGYISAGPLFGSAGTVGTDAQCEIRAVVTLASDIQLKPGTNGTWEIAN